MSKNKSDIRANNWLIGNTSLFFANSILTRNGIVNSYNIFDLGKLTEAILLANKIVVPPPSQGISTRIFYEDNVLFSKLSEEGIVEKLDMSEHDISQSILNELKDKHNSSLLNLKDNWNYAGRKEFIEILKEIFVIDNDFAEYIMSIIPVYRKDQDILTFDTTKWLSSLNQRTLNLHSYYKYRKIRNHSFYDYFYKVMMYIIYLI